MKLTTFFLVISSSFTTFAATTNMTPVEDSLYARDTAAGCDAHLSDSYGCASNGYCWMKCTYGSQWCWSAEDSGRGDWKSCSKNHSKEDCNPSSHQLACGRNCKDNSAQCGCFCSQTIIEWYIYICMYTRVRTWWKKASMLYMYVHIYTQTITNILYIQCQTK